MIIENFMGKRKFKSSLNYKTCVWEKKNSLNFDLP